MTREADPARAEGSLLTRRAFWTRLAAILALGGGRIPRTAQAAPDGRAGDIARDVAGLFERYAARDPVALPFAPDSLWNTPISAQAALARTTAFTSEIGEPGAEIGRPETERVRTGIEENAIVVALGPAPPPSDPTGVDPADLVAAAIGHPESPHVVEVPVYPNGARLNAEYPKRSPGHPAGPFPARALYHPDVPVDLPTQFLRRGFPLPRDWVKTNRPFAQLPEAEKAEQTAYFRGVARTVGDLWQTTVGNACLAVIAEGPFRGSGTCLAQFLGAERPAPGAPLWAWGHLDGAPGTTPVTSPTSPTAAPYGSGMIGWLSLWVGARSQELWPGASRLRHLLHFKDGASAIAPGDRLTAGAFRAVVLAAPRLSQGAWARGDAQGVVEIAADRASGRSAEAGPDVTIRRDGRPVARTRRSTRFEEPLAPPPAYRIEGDPAAWGGGPEPQSNVVVFAPGEASYLDASRFGQHGGAQGSCLGGSILVEELCAPGEAVDTIRHVVGLNVGTMFLGDAPPSNLAELEGETDRRKFLNTFQMRPWASPDTPTGRLQTAIRGHGRVWPAAARDGPAGRTPDGWDSRYEGSDPNVRMGSLLALPSRAWAEADPARARALGAAPFDLSELATLPARRIAWALMHFGGVALDTVGPSRTAKQSFLFTCEERHRPAARGRARHRLMGLGFYERFGFQMQIEHDWSRPSPADMDYPDYPTASEAWRRDVVRIMRRLCVVTNNLPGAAGGGGAPRLIEHVVAPTSLLGGFFLRDGAPIAFTALRLYRDGVPPEPVVADVFGRPLRNHATGADRAASAAIWGDLDRGWHRVGDGAGRFSPPIWLEIGARRLGSWTLA